jgi:NADPH:quinone reductase-like Zn-dependent oxidoreductase
MHGAMIKAFGEPKEVLELIDVQEPAAPAAGEVLVGVEYAPVNMNDLYVIQGAFPVRPSLPSFVGNEGVGRVLTVGSGVEHLKVGDRVLIPLYAFSWRERLVVPAAGLFSLPEADPKQLAMLRINPPTASLLLDEASDLKPRDWVVQNAANSGGEVGHPHRQGAGPQDHQCRAPPGTHSGARGHRRRSSGRGRRRRDR